MLLNNSLSSLPCAGIGSLQTQKVEPTKKRKMLVWSDFCGATTGFGVVSKHIMKALHDTGRYDINQLAINMFGGFPDKNLYPYSFQAARLGDPKDPYGNQMFIDAMVAQPYDLVFIINDTFVCEGISHKIAEVMQAKRNAGHPVPKIIYYYPVDCRFMPKAMNMVKMADVPVAYTNFAKEATLRLLPNASLDVIYHGTDIANFRPLDNNQKTYARKRFLGIEDPDTFVLINVNRNNIRKDIARSLLAFKEFRKQVPNSVMYIHTRVIDSPGHGQEIDLSVPVEELGLSTSKDVIFPTNLHPACGFPIDVLNLLYNAADAYITTTLGEGWGLTITEAMGAGIPVIVPNNTSLPEIVGSNGDRGYMYPCREQTYIDNSGFRWCGRMEDIVDTMMQCYNDWKTNRARQKEITARATQFVQEYSWQNVCKQWVSLFDKTETGCIQPKTTTGEIL